jgi:uncharacterized protein (TIGR00369 family)
MTDASHDPLERSHTMSGKPSGFRSLVGYGAIVWAQDYAEIELPLGPQHTNSLGIVHGGVSMTILDAAMGHATTWCAVKGNVRACVTISLTTTFIAPAQGKSIRAIARLVSIHDRVATCRGEVIDESGRLCASGQGSFRYLAGSEHVNGVAKLALART